jgi:hypothetical protein
MILRNNEDVVRLFYIYSESYKKDVDDLEEKMLREGKFKGRAYRPFPLDNRQQMYWIIQYLKTQNYDVSPLEYFIAPYETEFFRIRQKYQLSYLRMIRSLFRFFIFHSYFPEGGKNHPTAFEYAIRERDIIEAMKNELMPVIELRKELEWLKRKDENFIRIIPESVKKQTYFPMDLMYAPKQIWWRHLEDKYGKPTGFADIPFDS